MKNILYALLIAGILGFASCNEQDDERAENGVETVEEMEDEAQERTDDMEEIADEVEDTAAVIE